MIFPLGCHSCGAGRRTRTRDLLFTNWRRGHPPASTAFRFPRYDKENSAALLHRLPDISSGLATSLATLSRFDLSAVEVGSSPYHGAIAASGAAAGIPHRPWRPVPLCIDRSVRLLTPACHGPPPLLLSRLMPALTFAVCLQFRASPSHPLTLASHRTQNTALEQRERGPAIADRHKQFGAIERAVQPPVLHA